MPTPTPACHSTAPSSPPSTSERSAVPPAWFMAVSHLWHVKDPTLCTWCAVARWAPARPRHSAYPHNDQSTLPRLAPQPRQPAPALHEANLRGRLVNPWFPGNALSCIRACGLCSLLARSAFLALIQPYGITVEQLLEEPKETLRRILEVSGHHVYYPAGAGARMGHRLTYRPSKGHARRCAHPEPWTRMGFVCPAHFACTWSAARAHLLAKERPPACARAAMLCCYFSID